MKNLATVPQHLKNFSRQIKFLTVCNVFNFKDLSIIFFAFYGTQVRAEFSITNFN